MRLLGFHQGCIENEAAGAHIVGAGGVSIGASSIMPGLQPLVFHSRAGGNSALIRGIYREVGLCWIIS